MPSSATPAQREGPAAVPGSSDAGGAVIAPSGGLRRGASGPLRWLSTPWGAMLVMAALVALGVLLRYVPAMNALDLELLDLKFAFLARYAPLPTNDGIVVIGIDEATLAQQLEPVALSHRMLGRAFSALAIARPRAVGVDIVLPDRSFDAFAPGADQALITGLLGLSRVAPVVLGATTNADGSPRPIHPPLLAAARSTGDDFALLETDPDGRVRRFTDRLGAGGETVSTLVGRLAAVSGTTAVPGLTQYALGTGFDYLPMHDLLAWDAQGDVERLAGTLAGKTVLIGMVLAHEDRKRQPVALARWEATHDVPGVLVHAQMLRSQLAGATVMLAPLPWRLALYVLCASLWLIPTWRVRVGALVLLAIAAVAASVLLLRAGQELPLGAAMRVALAATALRSALEAWRVRQDRLRLKRLFGGYVSPGVLDGILHGTLDVDTPVRRDDFCFLFADLRDFTRISERLPPDAVVALLNRYFAAVTPVLHAHGGTVDNFRGDGVMAVFGAPMPLPSPATSAVLAARALFTCVEALDTAQPEGAPRLAIGISLACGDAIVGNVGAPERFNYTAIGDGANVAARLQAFTRTSGFPLVASAEVVARAQGEAATGWTPLGTLELRGHAPVDAMGWRAPGDRHRADDGRARDAATQVESPPAS